MLQGWNYLFILKQGSHWNLQNPTHRGKTIALQHDQRTAALCINIGSLRTPPAPSHCSLWWYSDLKCSWQTTVSSQMANRAEKGVWWSGEMNHEDSQGLFHSIQHSWGHWEWYDHHLSRLFLAACRTVHWGTESTDMTLIGGQRRETGIYWTRWPSSLPWRSSKGDHAGHELCQPGTLPVAWSGEFTGYLRNIIGRS